MAVKLHPQMIQDIASEFQAGRTIEEISIDSGVGKSNVKRALCEANLLSLSWYKTEEEDSILVYLETKGITTLQGLQDVINLCTNQ